MKPSTVHSTDAHTLQPGLREERTSRAYDLYDLQTNNLQTTNYLPSNYAFKLRKT